MSKCLYLLYVAGISALRMEEDRPASRVGEEDDTEEGDVETEAVVAQPEGPPPPAAMASQPQPPQPARSAGGGSFIERYLYL